MLIKEIPLRKSINHVQVNRRAYTYAHYYIHEEPLLSKFGKQKFWKEFVYLFLISDITIRWANCKVWRCVNYLLHCWRSLGSLQHILKSPYIDLLIEAVNARASRRGLLVVLAVCFSLSRRENCTGLQCTFIIPSRFGNWYASHLPLNSRQFFFYLYKIH